VSLDGAGSPTSDLLFAPDERSRETLEREGVHGRIEVVGDVMRDALDLFGPLARRVRNVCRADPRGFAGNRVCEPCGSPPTGIATPRRPEAVSSPYYLRVATA